MTILAARCVLSSTRHIGKYASAASSIVVLCCQTKEKCFLFLLQKDGQRPRGVHWWTLFIHECPVPFMVDYVI